MLAAGALLALAVPGRRPQRAGRGERSCAADALHPRSSRRSAHREHERRARRAGQGRHPRAQRELAGVHDGERGRRSAPRRRRGPVPRGASPPPSAPRARRRGRATRPVARRRARRSARIGAAGAAAAAAGAGGRRCARAACPGAATMRTVAAPGAGDADGGDAARVRTHPQLAHDGAAAHAQHDAQAGIRAQAHDHDARPGRADARHERAHGCGALPGGASR